MITGHDFYMVLSAMTPLYVAMLLAYASVRWWKVFTPDQCAGINRFVSVFAVPLLSFHFISKNNPYTMNWLFMAADTLQKIITLTVLILWACFTKNGSLDWVITLFSLATQPNTLVMGIPLLVAMYGQYCQSLMVQVVVMQCVIWYTLLLFLFEFRAAKLLIMDQFPETGASIASVKVESDVISLDGNDCLEADATVGGDGKLHVTVRRSNASRPRRSNGAPRPSNFSEAEIYSMSSTPRGSSFNPADFYTTTGVQGFPKRNSSFGAEDMQPVFKTSSSRTSNFDETAAHAREVRLSVSESVQTRDNKVNPEVEDVPKELARATSTRSAIGALETGRQMPPVGVMTKLILIMVWRKLMRNPNTYSSLIGLIWSLVHFRWNIEMPLIIEKSISILSDAGLGMAMFTLGLFMALQPSLIPCGKARATYAMLVRFLAGPAVMAAAALIFGIRGQLLEVSIVQAALPQGIVPFVFAKEYNVHPQILSTSVIFGMLVALPITLLYYILLGLR